MKRDRAHERAGKWLQGQVATLDARRRLTAGRLPRLEDGESVAAPRLVGRPEEPAPADEILDEVRELLRQRVELKGGRPDLRGRGEQDLSVDKIFAKYREHGLTKAKLTELRRVLGDL
jgi:hypothetical protein